MAAITACPIVAKANVAVKTQSSNVAAVKPFTGLKPASVSAKGFVSNGHKTSAMLVWTPVNNKFFETFSYLPPLTDQQVMAQCAYMTRNSYTPCIEFAMPENAYTPDHGFSGIESSASAGYYDNRYWTMWKLPMFGCTDPSQVLGEIEACKRAFPGAYVRICGFDNIKQVQTISFLVQRPVPAIPTSRRSV
jgi:ribulose-bisphosphate carboxylase small chain